MTSISKNTRDTLVLLNCPPKEILSAGIVTGLIIAGFTAVFLGFTYLTAGSLPHFIVTLFGVIVLTSSAGFLLKLEHRLVQSLRLTSGLPLLSTLSFVTLSVLSFVLFFGRPDFLGFSTLVNTFFILPIIFIFGLSLLYSFVVRILFLKILHRRCSLDYISLHYRTTVKERLTPVWESVRRYGGKLTLLLYRFEKEVPEGKKFVEAEEIDYLDRLSAVIKEKIRGSDETGIYSREIVWIIFPHTSAEEAHIPEDRIRKSLAETGFNLTASGISDMTDKAASADELVEKALARLGSKP